jgi:hypothetical protein
MTENEKALNSLKRLQELTRHLPTKRTEDKEALAEAVFDYVGASCGYRKAEQCMKLAQVYSLTEVISILEEEVSYDVEYHAGNQELPY